MRAWVSLTSIYGANETHVRGSTVGGVDTAGDGGRYRGAGRSAVRGRCALATPRAGADVPSDLVSADCWPASPRSSRRVRSRPQAHQRPRPLDGRRTCLWPRLGPEPPERGGAVGFLGRRKSAYRRDHTTARRSIDRRGAAPPRSAAAARGHDHGGRIPVTTVARTLFDLAEVLDLSRLERAFEAAERAELLDMRAVLLTAERNPGRRAHKQTACAPTQPHIARTDTLRARAALQPSVSSRRPPAPAGERAGEELRGGRVLASPTVDRRGR